MTPETLEIIIYVLVAAIILLIIWVVRLEIRLKNLLRGKDGGSLEETLKHLHRVLDGHQTWREKTDELLSQMNKRVRRSIQGIRTIRFNPFQDQGGNQSFATAFVNEDGDGVIISGLYSRDKVGVYAKPVRYHTSEHELSEEEKQALAEAKVE